MVQASVSAAGLGFSNGRIPTSFLASVGNGQVMEPHAAAQMNAALADMHAHGFTSVYVLEGYRSYDTQVYLRNGYERGLPGFNVAAVPGTSNHGDGRAADLNGNDMDDWDSAAQAYWLSIEAKYGYSSAQGRADNEPWHKVCTTWLDNITNTITEEGPLMALSDTEQTELLTKTRAVYDALFKTSQVSASTTGGNPIPGGVLRTLSALYDAVFVTKTTSLGSPGGVLASLGAIAEKLGIKK